MPRPAARAPTLSTMARWRWRRHTKHAAAKKAPEAAGGTVGADEIYPARGGSSSPGVWDRDRVLAAISEYAVAHDGRPPSAASAAPTGLRAAACREFGRWSTAVRAAGYEPLIKTPPHRATLETLARYEAGATVAELAADYDVSRQTIYKRLRRMGKWPGHRRLWDRNRVLTTIRKYAEAHDGAPPTTEAAKRMGGLQNAAHREFGSWAKAVEAAGYEPRRSGRPARPDLIRETYARRKAGATIAELAADYGVLERAIYKRLRRARELEARKLPAKATPTPMEAPGPNDPTPRGPATPSADRTTPAPLELVPEFEPSWIPARCAVTLGEDGRVALPTGMRGALGLRPGTRMVLTTEPDGSLRLRPCRTAADGRQRPKPARSGASPSPLPPSPSRQVGSGGPGVAGQLP